MVRAFAASGDYIKLTGGEYLSSDKLLKRGDILVKEGSHTAMVLTDGAAVSASDIPVAIPFEDNTTVHYSVRVPLLLKGMERDEVKVMQELLFCRGYDLEITGVFDEATAITVMQFQKDMNLKRDGKCGPDTWSALLCVTGVG
jgi:peptidoglycan hydrolase-like protein with peptidoglycan-binding domain